MSIKEYVNKMINIQRTLLEFLEDELNSEEYYENFIKIMLNEHINDNREDFKSVLHLINNISNNHQRNCNFISKIEQILIHFKNDIRKYFSNSEIFGIFKDNKRILLFFIQEKIIIIDEYIVLHIINDENKTKKYAEYFSPEIKPFLTYEFIKKYRYTNKTLLDENFNQEIMKEHSKEFYEKRKEGENDGYLNELIRKNEAKEFGVYLNRKNLTANICIDGSIFETNPFLLTNKKIKLIEYAAFHGSNDIIKFMQMNKDIKLRPSMWIYAVHSKNSELIKYLEDNDVPQQNDDYEIILKESIKCHHNELSNYIIDNLIEEKNLEYDIESVHQCAIKYYNYLFIQENITSENMFFYLCEFDYYTLVKLYLEQENIDINSTRIKISIF